MRLPQHYSKQHVVDLLNRVGQAGLADVASQELADEVSESELSTWLMRHGLSRDELISQMGGSP